MDLIADIGATNTRCALLDNRGQIVNSEAFANEGFASVEGVLGVFLGHRRATDRPKRAALAVAAPVIGDDVEMLNINWRFSQAELKQNLNLSRLIVVNDFAAIAWGLPALGPNDCRQIGAGQAASRATLAAVGPGSGLGVGSLVPANDSWAAISGEGGHVSLAAANAEEWAVIEALGDETGHCSAERVLSGPGLVRLYTTLASMSGHDGNGATPAGVTGLANSGEPLALATLDMFFALLGGVAGNVALTLGARGGVYVTGGVVPKMEDAFARSKFRERFVAKGRYRRYLEAIPTYLVTDPVPAFRGLQALLAYR